MKNIARSFTRNGVRYFVPRDSFWASGEGAITYQGRERFSSFKNRITKRWQPDRSFKTFSPRGHVAALLPHLCHEWFAVIDLMRFYDHVTRSKVHRSLANIGLPKSECFRVAGQSTVRQGDKYCLPRGFRQSALLAALVLDQSLFGSYLRHHRYGSAVTVFSDDIILSSDNRDELEREYALTIELLQRSFFPANPLKSQAPRSEVIVFNICLSRNSLRFTDERMNRFLQKTKMLIGSPADEEELESLSLIIAELNGRFGLNLGPEHRVTLGQMIEKLDRDAALGAAAC